MRLFLHFLCCSNWCIHLFVALYLNFLIEEEKYRDASTTLREVEPIYSELKGFMEEQWQLHESLLDSEKATEVMAINLGPKQGKLSSLLEYQRKLES
jgi:hypothetical protein